MEPDIVIVELHLILMSELCRPPCGALSNHPSWEPGLARAYYLEFREAWPGASRSLMDELEVRDFPLTGSTPLELSTLFHKLSRQEVAKEAVDFTVYGDL